MRSSRAVAGRLARRELLATAVISISALLASALAVTALLASAALSVALAASPEPTSAAGGDPRSSGQGPGLVGDPLLAVALVALIGVATLLVTLVYVRATGGSRRA